MVLKSEAFGSFKIHRPALPGSTHREVHGFDSKFLLERIRSIRSTVSKLHEATSNRDIRQPANRRHKSLGKNKTPIAKRPSGPQTWRIFGVNVHPDVLVEYEGYGAEHLAVEKRYLSPPVLAALYDRLKIEQSGPSLPVQLLDVRLVRRSLDARQKRRGDVSEESGPRFTYVLDVVVKHGVNLKLKEQPGRSEMLSTTGSGSKTDATESISAAESKRVIIVGAGPAGLFCALTLARQGLHPILLERGQAVESRGKHIGALMHRQLMNKDSNFAFGEGGAGTWSDGKLTTRIGRNSDSVRHVLETFVKYGAPASILIDGST
jgi:hypothetical protein